MLERCSLRRRLLPGVTAFTEGGDFGPTWPEVMNMERVKPEPRELTRSERAAIRKLVTGMCANYDPEYGCLPLDCPCYMLNKWWTGAYCKYFQNAVLPLDPKLEATLTVRAAPEMDTCAVCGKPFVRDGKRAYCSPACADAARRKRQREYMREKRADC